MHKLTPSALLHQDRLWYTAKRELLDIEAGEVTPAHAANILEYYRLYHATLVRKYPKAPLFVKLQEIVNTELRSKLHMAEWELVEVRGIVADFVERFEIGEAFAGNQTALWYWRRLKAVAKARA